MHLIKMTQFKIRRKKKKKKEKKIFFKFLGFKIQVGKSASQLWSMEGGGLLVADNELCKYLGKVGEF